MGDEERIHLDALRLFDGLKAAFWRFKVAESAAAICFGMAGVAFALSWMVEPTVDAMRLRDGVIALTAALVWLFSWWGMAKYRQALTDAMIEREDKVIERAKGIIRDGPSHNNVLHYPDDS